MMARLTHDEGRQDCLLLEQARFENVETPVFISLSD